MSILEKKVIYFMSVVEEGSFSAAAKKHYVSQANLSKQIQALENELGIELFNRSGYRPVINDAGKFFYENLLDIRSKEAEVYDGINKFIPGSIKVGFTGVFENHELIEVIRAFRNYHDGNEIELNRYDFDGCVSALLDDQVDLSFGLETIFKKYKDIKYDVLHGYDICFICTKNHPYASHKSLTIDDIKDEELVILSKKFSQDYYNDFMESCKRDGYKPNVKKEVDNFDELISTVCLGEASAIGGINYMQESELVGIPIKDTNHNPNYVVAYKKGKFSSSSNLFLKYVKDYFRTL